MYRHMGALLVRLRCGNWCTLDVDELVCRWLCSSRGRCCTPPCGFIAVRPGVRPVSLGSLGCALGIVGVCPWVRRVRPGLLGFAMGVVRPGSLCSLECAIRVVGFVYGSVGCDFGVVWIVRCALWVSSWVAEFIWLHPWGRTEFGVAEFVAVRPGCRRVYSGLWVHWGAP